MFRVDCMFVRILLLPEAEKGACEAKAGKDKVKYAG